MPTVGKTSHVIVAAALLCARHSLIDRLLDARAAKDHQEPCLSAASLET